MTATDGTDETPTVQPADGEASVPVDDSLELLSAPQIARMLGVNESSVRTLELSGEIFAIRRVGATTKQGYPAFQAWPGVAGAPLCLTLKALAQPGERGAVPASVAYGFFTSPTDLLADLAPLEVLLGRRLSQRAVDPYATVLLAELPERRLEMVLDTARAMAVSDMR